ncbi:MAG: hypothetical protein EYX74_07265 [Desulfobulbaceae bacterium]|nr:MAG: hypothetical protein EYX74_07265 [Desulfobulbaceae bacterium]
MFIDISAGAGQNSARPDRPDVNAVPANANRAQPERREAGRTSEVGSAVIASFSAAAMELARPTTEVEQQADISRTADRMEREDRGVAQANREEQARQAGQPERYTGINLVV